MSKQKPYTHIPVKQWMAAVAVALAISSCGGNAEQSSSPSESVAIDLATDAAAMNAGETIAATLDLQRQTESEIEMINLQ